MRMYIHTEDNEHEALVELSIREHRDPREQAALLVRRGLEAEGMMSQEPEKRTEINVSLSGDGKQLTIGGPSKMLEKFLNSVSPATATHDPTKELLGRIHLVASAKQFQSHYMSPLDALEAVKILASPFALPDSKSGVPNECYQMRLDHLELDVRTHNALKRGGLSSVGDVLEIIAKHGEERLFHFRGFGEKAFAELKEKLRLKGFLPQEE